MAKAKGTHHLPGIQRQLDKAPRNPKAWLRPTFIVTRGFAVGLDGKPYQLEPVYVAVLDANEAEATYQVLGCAASPSTISRIALRDMLEARGTLQV